MPATLITPAPVVPYLMVGGRELIIVAPPLPVVTPLTGSGAVAVRDVQPPGVYRLEVYAGIDTPYANSQLVYTAEDPLLPRFRLNPETTAMLVPVFAAFSAEIQESMRMSLGSYMIFYVYEDGSIDPFADEVHVGPDAPTNPGAELWYDTDAVPGGPPIPAQSGARVAPPTLSPSVLVQSGSLTATNSAKPQPPKYVYAGSCGCSGSCGSCSGGCGGDSLCECNSSGQTADTPSVLTKRARVAGTWQGDWDPNKIYQRWDVVTYEGRNYAYIGRDGGMCSDPL